MTFQTCSRTHRHESYGSHCKESGMLKQKMVLLILAHWPKKKKAYKNSKLKEKTQRSGAVLPVPEKIHSRRRQNKESLSKSQTLGSGIFLEDLGLGVRDTFAKTKQDLKGKKRESAHYISKVFFDIQRVTGNLQFCWATGQQR